MGFHVVDVRKIMKEGQIQIAIIIISLHIERTLSMFLDFYYQPKDVKPILARLDMNDIIELSEELKILKRSPWYSYFHQIRKLRNKIAHNLEYWELLEKDKKELKKATITCNNALKFIEMPISVMEKEVNVEIIKNITEMLKKAKELLKSIAPEVIRKALKDSLIFK